MNQNTLRVSRKEELLKEAKGMAVEWQSQESKVDQEPGSSAYKAGNQTYQEVKEI